VEISPEKLGHEVPGWVLGGLGQCRAKGAHRSSSGEIKTSLKLIICRGKCERIIRGGIRRLSGTHVLVLDVFQELQFAVGPLRQHGRTEGFHDLLHCDCDACELILCGAVGPILSLTDK